MFRFSLTEHRCACLSVGLWACGPAGLRVCVMCACGVCMWCAHVVCACGVCVWCVCASEWQAWCVQQGLFDTIYASLDEMTSRLLGPMTKLEISSVSWKQWIIFCLDVQSHHSAMQESGETAKTTRCRVKHTKYEEKWLEYKDTYDFCCIPFTSSRYRPFRESTRLRADFLEGLYCWFYIVYTCKYILPQHIILYYWHFP